MEINTILDQIDLGAMALPEFQRGYVWNRQQVRELMSSLYRRYPVGGLLVWITKTESAEARGDHQLAAGNVKLILDGQQRVTSLYGIIRGTPPPFFEGDSKTFTDLFFNVQDETFEFYGPVKMRDNPYWVSVTKLMKAGLEPYINQIFQDPVLQPQASTYISRLNKILDIRNAKFHIEEVTGQDKTVDVVVNIFNKVNSGGTKLSKGDLALAQICAGWPDARMQLRKQLAQWSAAGYDFKMDWLLRNVNTALTGEAMFSALKDVSAAQFQEGLYKTSQSINYLLNIISGRLGLDHDRVLGGRYAFPIMVRYLAENGGSFANARERDKLLYWYVHTFLWGRYAGSTESTLNQDLGAMEAQEDALEGLIGQLRIWRGDLSVRPDNFAGWGLGARFYPMLYLLTRIGEARDWGFGTPLKAGLLGKINQLQIHHVFPKSLLYEHNYARPDVNAVANFCFQTQDTNLDISNKLPENYFAEIEEKHPGALASQWIPLDRQLWRLDKYLDFLEARRELLAQATNEFLNSLIKGQIPESPSILEESRQPIAIVPGGIESEAEEDILLQANIWVAEQGLPEGEMLYQLSDEVTGDVIAILDLAWPDGIQTGYSEPVALLINEASEVLEGASAVGFRCFTNEADFRQYVLIEIMAIEPEEVVQE